MTRSEKAELWRIKAERSELLKCLNDVLPIALPAITACHVIAPNDPDVRAAWGKIQQAMLVVARAEEDK